MYCLADGSSRRDPLRNTLGILITRVDGIVDATVIEYRASGSVHTTVRYGIVSVDDEFMITLQHFGRKAKGKLRGLDQFEQTE